MADEKHAWTAVQMGTKGVWERKREREAKTDSCWITDKDAALCTAALLTLSICLKIERPCQAFLACSLALSFSLSVFTHALFIFNSPLLFPSLSPLQPLSNPLLSFSSSAADLIFYFVFSARFCSYSAFLYIAFSVILSSFLSLLTSRWYEEELQRYSTLQHDKCCSLSALNSSQWCTVMQTSMRAARERAERNCLVRKKRRDWSRDTKRNVCKPSYRNVCINEGVKT